MNPFSLHTIILQVPRTGEVTNSFPSFTILSIVFIATVFLTWYFMHRSKEKERLMLIEKGKDPSELPEMKVFNFSFPWLKLGIVIVSVVVGFFIGLLLEYLIGMSRGMEGLLIFAFMVLFGGIGMITAHYVDKS